MINFRSDIMLCILQCMYTIEFTNAEAGDILAESQFTRDTDGWFVTVEGGQTKVLTALPVEFDRVSKKIKSGDLGDLAWYFAAPQKFLGDQSSFYHGSLEFNLVRLCS